MTLLKINRLLPIYISIVPLKFEVDIQSQSKVRVWKPKKSNMAARQPFWKWRRWKSIGFCLWPPSTCIWNLKLKFQSKLDLSSGNHVVYRQTDRRTDKVNPVYPLQLHWARVSRNICSSSIVKSLIVGDFMTQDFLDYFSVSTKGSPYLAHWGWEEMDNILQTTFSNIFSSMKMFEFQLIFHWNLFLKVQLIIFQH